MSGDEDLPTLVLELRRTLGELEGELEPRTAGGFPRPPTPRELARFTSDVAIPAAILVLRVNIETLRLLQRTLRMAEGRGERAEAATEIGDRVRTVSRVTLDRLDAALADLQDAIEGRPPDDEARELIDRARDLRAEVDARLAAADEDDERVEADVPVDVEAELRSIRQAVDEEGRSGGADGGGEGGAVDDPSAGGDGGTGDGAADGHDGAED